MSPDIPRDDHGYHAAEREMQRRFDSTRLADRLAEVTKHAVISDGDRAFIESSDHFFLATGDAGGNLDCSYKGGEPGFVRVLDESTLAFPDYDGNGIFMSAGNILSHPKVGMLFIDWQRQHRMRLNGSASIDFDDELVGSFPGARFVVRVRAEEVFPNCPRYIHRMELIERSPFVPQEACEAPEPQWKDYFEDVLPADQQARRAARREVPAE